MYPGYYGHGEGRATAVARPIVTIHSDAEVGEGGAGSVTMTVLRDTAAPGAATIRVDSAGTARLGPQGGNDGDFYFEGLEPGGLITINPNQTSATFRVVPKDDRVIERPETVRMAISVVTGEHHIVGAPRVATVTIHDNDGGDKPPPGGGPGGSGGGGGVWEDPDPAEPTAWVDVSIGGLGGWWHDGWTGKDGERHYGSTGEGAGSTSGGILRLNRDFDESADYAGTTAPPKDLEKAGIVEPDDELAPLWLGAWADSGSDEAEAAGRWTLHWDDTKVNVYLPEFDSEGKLTGYARKAPGWDGTLEELYGFHDEYAWWYGWGLGALVDPVGLSTSVDDVEIQATFTPAQGSAVEDTVKATVYDADLDAHRTGGKFGEKVDDFTQWKGDPGKYIALVNNDYEEAPDQENFDDQFTRDLLDRRATVQGGSQSFIDDDLAKITLKKLPQVLTDGMVEIVLSNPGAVRLFTSDGTLLYDEGETSSDVLTLYLSSPSGYLAGLTQGDVDVWLEGLSKDANLTFSVVYKNAAFQEVARDSAHILVAEWNLIGGDGNTIPFVTRTSKDDLIRAAQDVDKLLDSEDPYGKWPLPFDSTKFKVHVDGLPSAGVHLVKVKSTSGSDDSYTAELAEGFDASVFNRFAVLYSSGGTGDVLSSSQRDLIRSKLEVDAVHNDEAEVVLETEKDQLGRRVSPTRSLTTFIQDGTLTGDEITQVELTKFEIYQIIAGYDGQIWTATNLTETHKQWADAEYGGFTNQQRRYELEAYDANVRKAKWILTFRNPAFQEYIPALYEVIRGFNPVQFVGEKSAALGLGYEPILGNEVARVRTAAEIVLYLAFLKGAQWVTSYTRNMAVAPLTAPAGSAVPADAVFTYSNGGKITIRAGQRFSPDEAVAAFERAAAGETVVLGKTDVAFGHYKSKAFPTADLEAFAQQVNATHSREWNAGRMFEGDLGFRSQSFDKMVNITTSRGGQIRFNLDDVDVAGALATSPANETILMTWWELHQVRKPELYNITTFYRGGRALTRQEVEAMGITPLQQ